MTDAETIAALQARCEDLQREHARTRRRLRWLALLATCLVPAQPAVFAGGSLFGRYDLRREIEAKGPPPPCVDHAAKMWGDADRMTCAHPDHRLEVQGLVVTCRCRR